MPDLRTVANRQGPTPARTKRLPLNRRRSAARTGVIGPVLALSPLGLWYFNSAMDGNILAPLQWMADLPVLGWIVDLPMRATLFLYTWPLPVGGPDPGAVFLGLYVLFAAALVRRQRFISAFLLVVLPLAASWWLFAQLAD